MQPYFFPYLGYFDLINASDRWIVFDTAQYIRHGWINRNRILHPNEGWQYVIVPLQKHSRETAIRDVMISASPGWKDKITGQLMHYRKKAPFFDQTLFFIRECLSVEERSISRLNSEILSKVCSLLEISFDYEYLSDIEIELDAVEEPGNWALRISEALKAEEYVNPPGADFFYERKFAESGIKLSIRSLPSLRYSCDGYEFVPDLSIIDLLMWNEPAVIKEHLDRNL